MLEFSFPPSTRPRSLHPSPQPSLPVLPSFRTVVDPPGVEASPEAPPNTAPGPGGFSVDSPAVPQKLVHVLWRDLERVF